MANQKLKMLYILELLSRESDEEHPIDAEQIMQYLQDRGMHCERKSVYSDVAVLKEYGYDILYTKAAKSGAIVRKFFQVLQGRHDFGHAVSCFSRSISLSSGM